MSGGRIPKLSLAWKALLRFIGWPAREGRWIEGTASSPRGMVPLAPFVPAERAYRLYLPRGYTRWRRHALLVACHGCRQAPQALADGARLGGFADLHRVLLLMPAQREDANAWGCWNWFESATAHGDGEAAIVEAMVRHVAQRCRVDDARVVALGISAGAALAAILGLRHPRTFRAVVSHSGVACGAARVPGEGRRVMAEGPGIDVAAIGRAAHVEGLRVPLLAIQGNDDDIVSPRNLDALVAQFLAFNAATPRDDDAMALLASAMTGWARRDGTVLPPPRRDERSGAGHGVHVRDWIDQAAGGRLLVRAIDIDGLGHAWSGGDPAFAYNDGTTPDALAFVRDFLDDIQRG